MDCYLCKTMLSPLQRTRPVVIGIPPEELAKMRAGEHYAAKVAFAHPPGECKGPMTLKCVCCGFEETFDDLEDAFQAGWDEPNHLPSWPLSCPLCPGVAAMGMIDHSEAHERWKREGRPNV